MFVMQKKHNEWIQFILFSFSFLFQQIIKIADTYNSILPALLNCGTILVTIAITRIKAFDSWNFNMALNTRSQEIRKLKESMEAANKEQTQRHEQVVKLLETYEQ